MHTRSTRCYLVSSMPGLGCQSAPGFFYAYRIRLEKCENLRAPLDAGVSSDSLYLMYHRQGLGIGLVLDSTTNTVAFVTPISSATRWPVRPRSCRHFFNSGPVIFAKCLR